VWLQTSERWRLFPPCPESCAAGRSLIASSWRCTKQKQSQSQSQSQGNSNTCVVGYCIFRGVCVGAAISSLATRPPQLLNCSTALSVAAASASDLVRSRKWPECQSGLSWTTETRPPTRLPTRDLPPSLFQRRPASSINQASKQTSNQSIKRS
jgi:hypothetical protein